MGQGFNTVDPIQKCCSVIY